MGKRIIQQRRGKGSLSYRVRRKAYSYMLRYPSKMDGEGKVLKLFTTAGHSAPLAKIICGRGVFYIPAFNKMIEGQKIELNSQKVEAGNIMKIKDIPVKEKIYCIESRPGDGGKFIKTAGGSAEINRKIGKDILVLMPSKKEKKLNGNCRAIIGVIAGAGRLEKPLIKAGRNFYIKKLKNKLWPRTSSVKMNVVDHPFGSGRGKRIKSKIPKRNSAPGQKVGLLSPRRTGKRK